MLMYIDSQESLSCVADYCHDAVFSEDGISYDVGNKVFSLLLTIRV